MALAVPGGPGLEAAPDHHQLQHVHRQAGQQEGGPGWREGHAQHMRPRRPLLRPRPILRAPGGGQCFGGELGEGEEDGEEAGGHQEVLEHPQLGAGWGETLTVRGAPSWHSRAEAIRHLGGVGSPNGGDGEQGEGQGGQPEVLLG